MFAVDCEMVGGANVHFLFRCPTDDFVLSCFPKKGKRTTQIFSLCFPPYLGTHLSLAQTETQVI